MKSTSLSLVFSLISLSNAIHLPVQRIRPRSTGSTPMSKQKGAAGLGNTNNILYTAEVKAGGTSYTLQLDTGSSDLWFAPGQNYNKTFASAKKYENLQTNLTYGTGWAAGAIAQTDVEFAGFTVKNQSFLFIEELSQWDIDFEEQYPLYQGIAGLSFDTLSQVNQVVLNNTKETWGRTLMSNIFLADPSTPNHIAFLLDRTGDLNDTDTGYFDIGTYAPGYEKVANQPKFDVFTGFGAAVLQWNVLVHGLSINGKKQHLKTSVVVGKDTGLTNAPPKGTVSALLDTGTSAAEIPEAAFHDLYKAMGGVLVKGTSLYVVPCLAQAELMITIDDVSISVHPLDLTQVQVDDFGKGQNLTFCTSVYEPASYGGADNDIILGDAFLRNVYAVYNYGDFVKTESGLNTSSPFIQVLPLTNSTAASEEFKIARANALKGLPPQLDVKTVNDPTPKALSSTSPSSKNGTSISNVNAALSAESSNSPSVNTSESESLKTLASLAPIALGLLGTSVGLLLVLIVLVGFALLQLRKQAPTRAAAYVPVPLNREQVGGEQAGIDQTKQEFHDLVGPMYNQKLMPVGPSDDSSNPTSLTPSPSPTPDPTVAGPSNARSSKPSDAPVTQSRPLVASKAVPVSSLSDVKAALRSVIGIIPTSSLQDEMGDLLGCCHVLTSLLEKTDVGIVSAPQYNFIFSKMREDLNDMILFLNEWTKKKSAFQQMQRKDVHVQVRTLEDTFTRHLHIFIALSQVESTTVANREFSELQAKMNSIQNHAHTGGGPDPRNTDQANSQTLREQVRQITGHTPDAAYILSGKISYREATAINQKKIFDVYKGKLQDGEAVAIKLLRPKLKNNGEGVRFVERIMRQVQLWSSFSSPFILECRGIGMQMKAAEKAEDYDEFQFYLVSPFMARRDAATYIHKLRKEGGYVDILKYLREAARGIEYLHRRDPPCVHAGVRGENIIIKDNNTACLNGFGLTKAFTAQKIPELTGLKFKYRWMAPELLAQDKPPLTPSCDIWAWAMTALQLITGKKPYYKARTIDLYDHVVKQRKRPELSDYPTFEQNCPQPEKVWTLLKKCWVDASERPSIQDVIRELEDIERAQIEQQDAPHVWT
ncbi:unnamed protein product [Rhizoctonia solani]|uniref:Protein kinase domain-containing protein n=1 Tax=Rhizoctonia solani TaxID=456999 RepID=A0A8H3EDE1_9AGAM|nr:unnamed protein product [Rhizoctonia solani]